MLSGLSGEEQAYSSGTALSDTEPLASGDEAFAIPSDVAYCAEALNASSMPSRKSGKWAIAENASSLDYLWNSIRVAGGAYGADFSVSRKGVATFSSWQDPYIDETLERFHEVGPWLQGFDPDDEELDGYVISTTGSFDRPSKGLSRLVSQSRSHLFGWTM